MEFRITGPDGKKISIPLLYRVLPNASPGDPSPWRDIYTIAFMDELAKTLSSIHRKPIQTALHRSAIGSIRALNPLQKINSVPGQKIPVAVWATVDVN
jgi:hypothetical protein